MLMGRPRPVGRGRAEHGALFDAHAEVEVEEGYEDASEAPEEGADRDAAEGVGQDDEDAGGDVAGSVRGIAYSTGASSPRSPARW